MSLTYTAMTGIRLLQQALKSGMTITKTKVGRKSAKGKLSQTFKIYNQ